jgi:hypothetical protein
VVGFWRSDNLLMCELQCSNDSFACDYVVQTFHDNVHHWDYGKYDLVYDTLILTYDSFEEIEKFQLIRQNKRKLILKPLDKEDAEKLKFKRFK